MSRVAWTVSSPHLYRPGQWCNVPSSMALPKWTGRICHRAHTEDFEASPPLIATNRSAGHHQAIAGALSASKLCLKSQ